MGVETDPGTAARSSETGPPAVKALAGCCCWGCRVGEKEGTNDGTAPEDGDADESTIDKKRKKKRKKAKKAKKKKKKKQDKKKHQA
mgnify:CR=1 FL=1